MRSKTTEPDTTETTIQDDKNNLNNCEDMKDSFCCCLCFKFYIL